MKKTVIILTSIFLLYSVNLFSQEKLLISYVEKRIFTEGVEEQLKNLPEYFQKQMLLESTEGVETFLFIDGNKSIYSAKSKHDHLILEKTSEIEKKYIKSESDYYKDFENELLIIKRNKGEEEYIAKLDLHPIDWTLLEETKEINSLVCKKAIGLDIFGKSVTAWYTEQIKLPNGPSNYGGLPGLIIILQKNNRIFELTKIEETSTTNEIDLPRIDNAILIEEYIKTFYNNKKGFSIVKRQK